MGLQRELADAGSWLFRWRSFLPLSMVFLAVLSMLPDVLPAHHQPSAQLLLAGSMGISVLGLIVRVLTVGFTPAKTSGRNTREQIADVLNTTGIYSTVRHPLYLGNFLIGLGLACMTLKPWFPFTYSLAFWLYYERIMMAEEAFLRGKFEQEFNEWARVTPAFIPSFKNYRRSVLPFSLKNVLRREYSAVLQIAAVGFLLKFLGDWFDSGRIIFSPPWFAVLAASAVTWFVLRSLKRNTSLLQVEGR
jgi:protein-S-isoprenylcysteine O-methyltransferase Ste14